MTIGWTNAQWADCHKTRRLLFVALRACVLKTVAGHARPLIQHRSRCMAPIREQRKGHVAPWRLVMTPHAGLGNVTGGARRPVQRRYFSMHVITPSGGMTGWLHYLMASNALIFVLTGA